MVQFRLRKKLRESSLRMEHAQLEGQMQRCLAALKRAAAKNNENNVDQMEVTKWQQNLVLQADALRFQNQKLQKVVTDNIKLQKVIHAEGERVVQADNSQSLIGGSSWLVTFSNQQPPFHFHPFTKKESEEIIQNYDQAMAIGIHDFIEVGTLLGWKADRLPLVLHANGRWMVTRVKFSKQIRCAAGESEATMKSLEAASWPVLTAPELCPCVHRSNSTALKLQEIDKDTVVIVSDTPEQSRGMNLRYLTMMHRRRSVDNEGRRCITYVMAIPDSKANKGVEKRNSLGIECFGSVKEQPT
ncbi:hypothetical protein P3T76_005678 [Phytophthora citrophthora]|uniref:Uncharacterized protein n=1 Tax=Phytophthora citrophthora TaxID=4793 RepID=A0AAD9LP06_9STRA|nr:hypothetical protein P3T76_005678 [Phytophthora citrophthora]